MRLFVSLVLLLSLPTVACADWTLPLSFTSGSASTGLSLGIESGATDGYDAGQDAAHYPYDGDLLHAAFPHPDWGVNLGGEAVTVFSRDIRGTVPQEFSFEVRGSGNTVSVSWSGSDLPPRTTLELIDSSSGQTIDMAAANSYRFQPGSTAPVTLKVRVTQGDVAAPAAPAGVSLDERFTALFLTWSRNSEADLAGYKVHFGTETGRYTRTIDVRKVANYSLLNLDPDVVYYAAVTAYDAEGNESGYSNEVSGSYQPLPRPNGDLAPIGSRDGAIGVGDAVVALRMALGLVAVSETDRAYGDVAPLVDGVPAPDGEISIGDAVVILRKAIGAVNF